MLNRSFVMWQAIEFASVTKLPLPPIESVSICRVLETFRRMWCGSLACESLSLSLSLICNIHQSSNLINIKLIWPSSSTTAESFAWHQFPVVQRLSAYTTFHLFLALCRHTHTQKFPRIPSNVHTFLISPSFALAPRH